jgi:hypothetical protein
MSAAVVAAASANSNICWNCGQGKQPIYGGCAKCGSNLAGEQPLASAPKPERNWKFVFITAAVVIIALIAWGFSQGIARETTRSIQSLDVSETFGENGPDNFVAAYRSAVAVHV